MQRVLTINPAPSQGYDGWGPPVTDPMSSRGTLPRDIKREVMN
eukprot:SAG25_NODE_1791_length_2326_cov_1.431971_4_plen_42_part_01